MDYLHVKKQLPKHIFKPYRLRLIPIVTVWLMGVLCVFLICTQNYPWYLNLGISLLIGYFWSAGGLFAHELLHGSVIRSRSWQTFIGFFCLLPYLISPTFWRYWHNNLHHSHTQKIILDPDAYPTLKIFKQSRFAQWMYPVSPGSGYKRSYLYLFFWFSFNAQVIQHYLRYRNKTFAKINHKQVNLELGLAIAIHIAAITLVGPANWAWVILIPFLVMNYLPFSYISTNHNLSPLTKKNDPLTNSLTVTNHPILEFFHINFGYHVEHHMFPTVSGTHLKKVHSILKEEHADTYQVMPKWKALQELYRTPRIYKNSKTLVHPESLATFPTLGLEATENTQKPMPSHKASEEKSGLIKIEPLEL